MIIGSLSVLIMLGFTVFAGYLLFSKCYYSFKQNHNFNQVPTDDTPQIIEEIHCDDIKATVITISQHQQINEALDNDHQMMRYDQKQAKTHWRQRSMSDPELLADCIVDLAIESQSASPLKSHRIFGKSPGNVNKQIPSPSNHSNHSSQSTETMCTEEYCDQSTSVISPLSSPKGHKHSCMCTKNIHSYQF